MATNHRILEEIDIELIERIKLSPCLYDTRNPDFRLVFRKDRQWQRVSDGLGMSDSEARRRWTALRDRYARELKQMYLNPHNTQFGKNEFFVRMDFLRKFVKKRRERKRLGDLEESMVPIKVIKMECDATFPFETVDLETDGQMKQSEEVSQESNNYSYNEETKQEDFEEEEFVEEVHEFGDTNNAGILDKDETLCQPSVSNFQQKASMEVKPSVRDFDSSPNDGVKKQARNFSHTLERDPTILSDSSSDSDELFSRVLASYLKNLSRRYKIKAKVEMMQIVEKYIEIEENERPT